MARGGARKRRGSSRTKSGKSRPLDAMPLPLSPEEHALFSSMGGRVSAPVTRRNEPSIELRLSDQVQLAWAAEGLVPAEPCRRDARLGSMLCPPDCMPESARELVMGLDFGTSATKVVVADRSLKVGFAVPLVESVGLASYILPSAVVEMADGTYALSGEGKRHADLKLAMLANISDEVACSKVCAFLALVIRSVRAWLYESKRDQYLKADILWTLALGQPLDPEGAAKYQDHFEHLALVAWALAGRQGAVSVSNALETWECRNELNLADELEVRVMAELSAQIHGFVSSSNFDPRYRNIYLMVDVGAGTVDASLFRVHKEGGGAVGFSLFTHSVRPLGAANLHRHRLDWWILRIQLLMQQGIGGLGEAGLSRLSLLLAGLEKQRVPTEFRGAYPASYRDYVNGLSVSFSGGAKSPDEEFNALVLNQVAGQVLYGAWKQQLLEQDDVRGMPFFLCGGGARHQFYSRLKSELQHTPNCTWLSASPRALTLPKDINAPGVSVADYDRLSVAYGLSQLNPGSFKRVSALRPRVKADQESNWISSTADKSAC